jgi:hypothetical protein
VDTVPAFSDISAMAGLGYSGRAKIVGLVVSIVPAGAEAHLWRINTMWRSSLIWRPGRHIVVCFVVLIVVALGDVRVLGTAVARERAVLVHVQPPSPFEWLPIGRRHSFSARFEVGAMV